MWLSMTKNGPHDKALVYSENATKSKNHVILGSLPGQHPTHHP